MLNASERDYSESDKKILEEVKSKTCTEKERYHNDYSSAKQVRDNFISDLHSEAAKSVHAKLKRLELPRLPDIRDEFLELCDRLGVK